MPVPAHTATSPANLWELALNNLPLDAEQLIAAIVCQVDTGDLDFRTRLLIRDALAALKELRGEGWLQAIPPSHHSRLEQIADEPLGDIGFPSLRRRLMSFSDPEIPRNFLRELGHALHARAEIVIGGSTALILAGLLTRRTEDIDIVDEIPASIRSDQALLSRLQGRYDLRLAHFQSHYLPEGWRDRIKSLGRFGEIEVFAVDEYDIAVGKLFSKRDKDLDDLRALKRSLERANLQHRLKTTGGTLLREPELKSNADRNWYILFGEPLPA